MPLLLRTLTLAVLLLAAAAGNAAAAAVPAGSTVLVDRPTGFGPLPFDGVGGSQSGTHALSADGRFAVLSSRSDTLLEGAADDAGTNIYRVDTASGRVEQVNTTSTGAQPEGHGLSGAESISADGRYVAFTAFDSIPVPGGPGVGVYVKDMDTGDVELVSRGTGRDGRAADGLPIGVISGDGRHVVFTADGPVDADNVDGVESQTDVYVRNLDTGATRMVSVTFNGAAGGSVRDAFTVDINFNGTAVAFITEAGLIATDDDNDHDAYLRTGIGTAGEATRLVSFSTGQEPGAGRAEQVALSGDAKSHVAWSTGDAVFTTVASAVAVDKAIRADVARQGGSTGTDADTPAFEPVAAPGPPARLYFRTAGTLDPAADTNGSDDIYGAELRFIGEDAQHVHLATSGTARGPTGPGVGARDGASVVYSSESRDLPGAVRGRSQVYLRAKGGDLNVSQPLGSTPRTNEAGSAHIEPLHAVSDDGRLVAFQTEAPALGSDDPENAVAQIAVRDIVSGETTLVSARPDGTPGDGFSGQASIDAAGDQVAFVSDSTTLLPSGNPNGPNHVYVRDLRTGVTTLVDRTATGAPLARGAGDARISADGRHLVYLSRSPDAPEAPAGGKDHLYRVDLSTGATQLVDRAADGTPANDSAEDGFDLSGDGTRVAFESEATNLGVAGSTDHQQIYVRDTVAGTTEWVSAPEGAGDPKRVTARHPSLSRSGARVAFTQFDPDFGYGMSGRSQVFLRDLASQTTTIASNVPGASASSPSLSADGRRVAFAATLQSDRATLATLADTPDAESGVYLRDLDRGTSTLVSVRADGKGARGPDADTRASLAGSGACVAFESESASAFGEPAYGPDFSHVYLRAVDDDCPTPPRSAAPGDTPPGGGSGVLPDRTAPVISRARLTRKRFALGGSKTARSAAAARGTTFVFTLSEPATTTITVSRRVSGRRSGRRCVKPRKGLKRRCTRIVKQLTLTRKGGRAGANRVAFSGRVGRTALKPGSYQASLVARDGAGNRSRTRTLTFRIVP